MIRNYKSVFIMNVHSIGLVLKFMYFNNSKE